MKFDSFKKNAENVVKNYLSNDKNFYYEGQNISDLEQSGLQTINLLKAASPNITNKPKFNVPLLNAIPINSVLQFFNANKIKKNIYEIYGQQLIIKENKWYNKTQNKGNINAISLVMHLTAIAENIDEQENKKILFVSACKKLDEIQKTIQNNKITVNWKQIIDQLNNIPLNLILEHIGANPNEDGQRGKWKIWKTGHNVHVTGQKWYDWNAQKGGYGGISLLASQLGIENNIDDRIKENEKYLQRLAIKELIKAFGTEYNLNDYGLSSLGASDASYFKEPFSMPHVIDFKINAVRQYLNEKRCLPMWVINKQIKAGYLFAGFPSDWKPDPNLNNPDKLTNDKVWATFLALNGNAAEMRAIERTDQYAKILAKGSDKNLGGFLIKAEKDCNEKTVAACEAAIDTMSYHAFYPGRVVISCMGVNFNLAVKSAVEALDKEFKFELAFDNDLAGNEAAVRFREHLIYEIGEEEYNKHFQNGNINYFDLGIKCLRKTIKDGGIFYFDVKNNEIGKTAVTMFQEQLLKVISRETIKELNRKGKIKYINITPNYGTINDPEKEARQAVNLLLSSKPFYLILKQSDDDEKDEVKVKRNAFEQVFLKIAGNHINQFEKEGKIIYKKQVLAKDWNEFFILMKKDPKFQEKLNELEEKYSFYNEESNLTKKMIITNK